MSLADFLGEISGLSAGGHAPQPYMQPMVKKVRTQAIPTFLALIIAAMVAISAYLIIEGPPDMSVLEDFVEESNLDEVEW